MSQHRAREMYTVLHPEWREFDIPSLQCAAFSVSGCLLDVGVECTRSLMDDGADVALAYSLPGGKLLMADASMTADGGSSSAKLQKLSSFHQTQQRGRMIVTTLDRGLRRPTARAYSCNSPGSSTVCARTRPQARNGLLISIGILFLNHQRPIGVPAPPALQI